MVLAYRDSANATLWIPFYDIVFKDKDSNFTLPNHNNPATYTVPTDASKYFYMQDGGDLTMAFNMSWSSPCENGVIGC